jgi:general secretion pathway protein M
MKAFESLSFRERALLFVAFPVVAIFAGHQFAWLPLQELREAREAEIASYRFVAQSAAKAGTQIAPVEEADAAPFAARVTQSAEAAGLSLRRLEPEGDRLRVAIDEAPFAQVVLWIADLEAEQDVLLAAIEIDRRIVPGTVSARLLLEATR